MTINQNLNTRNVSLDDLIRLKAPGFKFMIKYRIRYYAFRSWLKLHHYMGMNDLSDEWTDYYVGEYRKHMKGISNAKNFEDKFGVDNGTFRAYLKRTYAGLLLSEVPEERLEEFVEEYKKFRNRKRKGKRLLDNEKT